ncbi:uncharacterized protein [Rutidosis leptorrhynchoides]|uniref:uncharacterized protein n=1 Tax=Rutidosis leptorrhynchoides TaxID=125765 RepID=UPI003A9A44BE
MNLLQNAIRSSSSHLKRNINPNLGLRSFLSGSPSHRQLSTESSPATNQPSFKPFFETPSEGLVYGRLLGITNNTLKSDVLSLLEECNLSPDDLKVDYNPSYSPTGMMVQFSSRSAYDAALKAVTRKRPLYKLERADRAKWNYIQTYGGKFVLLQGIPLNASLDDIERFLDGCEYDPSNIRLFSRQGLRMAIIPFLSPTAAMSATITKNRGFCFNNQISMHVLQ